MRAARRLSALRPLAWRWWLPACALGLVLGQTLGDAGRRPMLLAVAAGAASPSILYVHRALGTASILAASSAALGAVQAWRQERARRARSAHLPGAATELRGRVAAVRLHRARGGSAGASLDLCLTASSPGFAAGETVRVAIWKTDRQWLVGDEIVVRAVPRAPRGFCNQGRDAYARAAWRQGVVAVAAVASDRAIRVTPWDACASDVGAVLASARRGIARALAEAVPSAGARGVLAALIYGDQSSIPVELRDAYARTGTAHVLSVSGLHIAVVGATAFGALRWLAVRWSWLALRTLVVRWAALAAIVPAAGYAFLSGGAVATLRALAMGALGLGAVALVRRADVWSALSAAALLLCAKDPGVAGDASFQLSFAAVAALVLAGSRVAAWRTASGAEWPGPAGLVGRMVALVVGAVVAAVAAGIATGPITSYHFGSVALLGVIANLVVVPLVGWFALLLGLAGAVLVPFWSGAATCLLEIAAAVIEPGNEIVLWLAGVRGAAIDVALPSAIDVLAVIALAAAPLARRGWPRRSVVALSVVLLLVGAARRYGDWGAPAVTVRFLDVGQGDAILVQTSPGEGVLVDAGGLGGAYDPGERVVVPALRRAGLSELAVMVLSHPDHDHHGGLAAVARLVRVAEFWSAGQGSPSESYRALATTLEQRLVEQRAVRRDAIRSLAGGAALRVLHPSDPQGMRSRNDGSLIIQVTYGSSRVLLTGDVEAAGEADLLRRPAAVASTIIKVPHHGSRTSSTRRFVAASRPALAIALLGADNRFGFPAPEVRRRYGGMGAAWLQSDRDGEVVVQSDGQLEVVATCRQS